MTNKDMKNEEIIVTFQDRLPITDRACCHQSSWDEETKKCSHLHHRHDLSNRSAPEEKIRFLHLAIMMIQLPGAILYSGRVMDYSRRKVRRAPTTLSIGISLSSFLMDRLDLSSSSHRHTSFTKW